MINMKWLANLNIGTKILGGFLLVVLVIAIMTILSINGVHTMESVTQRVMELRAPTVLASKSMENGVNKSLAGLRGWMILGKDKFKKSRLEAWKEIDTAFATMKEFSRGWTNPKNVERLAAIEASLSKFRKAQEEIEAISGTIENTPATKILVKQAAPLASILVTEITNMINLEAKLAATPARKDLLGMMADVRGTTARGLANIRAFLLTGDQKFHDKFNIMWTKNIKRFADLQSHSNLLTVEQKVAFNKFSRARASFKDLPGKMFNIRGGKQWNLANYWLGSKAAPEAGKIMANLVPMVQNQEKLTTNDIALAQEKIDWLNSFMIVTSVIGALIALILGVVITRMITVPLKQMLAAADDLRQGDGDLTQRLPDFGNNEIGKTAHAFNGFVEKIQNVLIEVSANVDSMSQAAEEISATSQSLSQGASEQAASVEETSASLEQMSASINQNTDNARATENIATSSSEQAQDGGQAVGETVSAMTTIAAKISLIEDIAYKTNLLALNAAIEAARAGEHGKGFAVVADEVRKLAERSESSAQEISELAANSVKVAQRAGELINEIVPGIGKTADLVQEITAASEEQSSGVTQVTTAMEQLDKGAQQGASSSEELAATAEEMSTQMVELQRTVGFFKLNKHDNSASRGVDMKGNVEVFDAARATAGYDESDVTSKDFERFGT